ncbi:thioredoxin-like domain-containing protein [Telmatospirillum sp. J64-1]|uniref:thioredoxin-like domain-containing protein n=1 Tax=Telmatospirillum sp. J64-1 TaxID=2502183 RepID=UPI00115F707F|nr:thioredoxin-like domain-containing protein [Telmatospirillum sp. J64-1]
MFGITRAPEIDRPGLTWFNTSGPLSLRRVAGRIVILDFWTSCCINCIHVLPSLRRIEEAYPNEVAVIGIHSPKFEAERDPQALAKAIARYDIQHPVAHDPQMLLWQEYAVRAWPTLVFVSPDGYVMGQLAGEPHPDRLLDGIGDMVREFWERGELKAMPLDFAPVEESGAMLRFPGKIKPVPGREKLWAVADAGHHQVVLLDDEGQERARFGSGRRGFGDGPADQACFDSPQGLVCSEEAIYVADTGNHAIRHIDRASGMVSTLAGTGMRGTVLKVPEAGEEVALASPWDLELDEGRHLYFANAGTHQLGELDLETGILRALAGSGAENIVDGPAMTAQLAQPSGLALSPDGHSLYFADSETSSIRRLSLAERKVETLVGSGLFDFGHVNGPFPQARLQHALGVAAVDGRLYVADSYNGVVRVLDLEAETVSDLDGPQCIDPVCFPAAEPAGIVADGPERLLLSDTNNHRILEYRLDGNTYRSWA